MITEAQFFRALYTSVPQFSHHQLNPEQNEAVVAPADEPLMIVAGPGSGKTTVLVLRALRLMLVDGYLPETILLTTFTIKAADELRARLLDWGRQLVEHVRASIAVGNPGMLDWLESVDVNRFRTGTLDSICQEVLTTLRDRGDVVPVLIEEFAAKQIMLQQSVFPSGAHRSASLGRYLGRFGFEGQEPRNTGQRLDTIYTLYERIVQDQVDVAAYATQGAEEANLCSIVGTYQQFLGDHHLLDFPALEKEFLERLEDGRLDRFTSTLQAVLVDEYQDTNPLQESIYHGLVRSSGASLTVVGDDDQSLYRFRGATVELFRDFAGRLPTSAGQQVGRVNLFRNYRSTPEIVDFFNSFITSDPAFSPARIHPLKPPVRPELGSNGVPILGLFRDSVEELAADLATYLVDIFRGGGWRPQNTNLLIQRSSAGGDFGDAVLLGHSVREHGASWGSSPPRERLPLHLRRELSGRGVGVFNPRGTALRSIESVKQLLGLVLECIDAGGRVQQPMRLTNQSRRTLADWRDAARAFIQSNPPPTNASMSLGRFVTRWGARQRVKPPWPPEWPLLDLVFKLISWIPALRDDPEGQVYLEAVARTIAAASSFSPYRSQILDGQGLHDDKSVEKVIQHILVPIAEEAVAVDEDLLTHVPRNQLPIMTIHQAKGLEFPITIIDVSSAYSTNHAKNRFRRHPKQPSAVQVLEDEFSSSTVGGLRRQRDGRLRSFDDLIRLYYVAYSRSQSVLVLTGLSTSVRFSSTIRHVGLCWHADDTWAWKGTRSNGSLAGNLPFVLV